MVFETDCMIKLTGHQVVAGFVLSKGDVSSVVCGVASSRMRRLHSPSPLQLSRPETHPH